MHLHRNVSVKRSQRSQQSDDRDLNLILFGLPESGLIVDSIVVVDEILEFLAKKPILNYQGYVPLGGILAFQ